MTVVIVVEEVDSPTVAHLTRQSWLPQLVAPQLVQLRLATDWRLLPLLFPMPVGLLLLLPWTGLPAVQTTTTAVAEAEAEVERAESEKEKRSTTAAAVSAVSAVGKGLQSWREQRLATAAAVVSAAGRL